MRSKRQIQASRANGAKSRGPITPEGKQASSRNAITHGMLSSTIVLDGEVTDRFLALFQSFLGEYQPQTPTEEALLQNMAVARWRQMRLWGLEKVSMQYEIHRRPSLSESEYTPATSTAIAFRSLSDNFRSLELLNRYEARCDRQFYRAHRRLLELQDRRTPPPALVPATPDPIPPYTEGTLPARAPDPGTPESFAQNTFCQTKPGYM